MQQQYFTLQLLDFVNVHIYEELSIAAESVWVIEATHKNIFHAYFL